MDHSYPSATSKKDPGPALSAGCTDFTDDAHIPASADLSRSQTNT